MEDWLQQVINEHLEELEQLKQEMEQLTSK